MYCKYFGFTERPFEVSPDPDFLYLSPGHREMLAALVYGIQERKGLIAVIGEVGTGKTTMLKALMAKLNNNINYAYIFNCGGSFEEFLNQLLIQFGLKHKNEQYSVAQGVQRLQDYSFQRYQRGGNVVLIIDEAQNLDRDLMENIRLLSNYETGKHKLIQIVLSGQLELDEKLRRYDLRQLAQRINLRRYVIPLSRQDTNSYIQHRLTLSGYQGTDLFSHSALRRIWRYSGGIPRKINVICDNVLLTAYGLNKKRITSKIVKDSIADLGSKWSLSRLRVQRLCPSPIFCLVIVIGFSFVMWAGLQSNLSETSAFSLSREKAKPDPNWSIQSTQEKISDDAFLARGEGRKNEKPLSNAHGKATRNQSIGLRAESNFNPKGKNSESTEKVTFVIARPGDSLSKILRKNYGDFRVEWLDSVMEMNPSITDVNVIDVGQAIKLPSLRRSTRSGSDN